MAEPPLYIAEVRACLEEIREQQEQFRQRTDLTLEQRLDEVSRITHALIRLQQEWSEMLDDMSRKHNRDGMSRREG
jgi:hypothetical protein